MPDWTTLRTSMRTQLIEVNRFSEADADRIIEVAFDAALQAMDTIKRTVEPLEGPVWLNAYSLAFFVTQMMAVAGAEAIRITMAEETGEQGNLALLQPDGTLERVNQ